MQKVVEGERTFIIAAGTEGRQSGVHPAITALIEGLKYAQTVNECWLAPRALTDIAQFAPRRLRIYAESEYRFIRKKMPETAWAILGPLLANLDGRIDGRAACHLPLLKLAQRQAALAELEGPKTLTGLSFHQLCRMAIGNTAEDEDWLAFEKALESQELWLGGSNAAHRHCDALINRFVNRCNRGYPIEDEYFD